MVHKSGAVLGFDGSDFARYTRLTVRFFPSNTHPPATAHPQGSHPPLVLRLRFRRAPSEAGLVHVLLAAVNASDNTVAEAAAEAAAEGQEQRSADPSRSDGSEVSWTLGMEDVLVSKEGEEVQLVLTVVHRSFLTLHVEYLRLEVRPPPEAARDVYRDTMTAVQAVQGATLPAGASTGGSPAAAAAAAAAAERMALYRPDSGASWLDVDAVTVLKKVSWSEDDFEEILRLDRWGTLRLKPRSAYASRSPPYGTSVVLGPSDPRAPASLSDVGDEQPTAPISRVDIDPWALKFTLTYVDSSVSEVTVRSGSFGVRATVNVKRRPPSSGSWPLAVVTSMWVADGKADVDHVSANGAEPRAVVSGDWTRLFGTSFAFFRQCVSRHNTQAPDLTLELMEPHPDLHVDTDSF